MDVGVWNRFIGIFWFKTSNNQNLKSFTKQALYLVFEINDVNALFKKNDYNYELSEGDILGIQNSLLSRN